VLQRRSVREFNPASPVAPERVPPEAQFVSLRLTTPLFGAGLIEAIPDEEILRHADPNDADHDGISGRVNRVFNPETGALEVGRFGWKAQHSSLHVFTGDAYLNEMGLTSMTFQNENLPQGHPLPPGADPVADPEETGARVEAVARYMQLLAPKAPPAATPASTRGAQVFTTLGCAGCHTPTLQTGDSSVAALARQPVRLYSDLLLHEMGPSLADGIRQGAAQGGEWRTAPLWGAGARPFYMHDGRARTLEMAIMAHDGEGRRARDAFAALSAATKRDLTEFLRSL
jgi:CxxC motif-containing protein (DUF1111 family)